LNPGGASREPWCGPQRGGRGTWRGRRTRGRCSTGTPAWRPPPAAAPRTTSPSRRSWPTGLAGGCGHSPPPLSLPWGLLGPLSAPQPVCNFFLEPDDPPIDLRIHVGSKGSRGRNRPPLPPSVALSWPSEAAPPPSSFVSERPWQGLPRPGVTARRHRTVGCLSPSRHGTGSCTPSLPHSARPSPPIKPCSRGVRRRRPFAVHPVVPRPSGWGRGCHRRVPRLVVEHLPPSHSPPPPSFWPPSK